MNSAELQRLLIVVLPAAAAIAVMTVIVAAGLSPGSVGEFEPGEGPRIGRDHWHATYQLFVCGERQPNFPTWEAGVHTHGDGVIHVHPFLPAEEGEGARLVKWFEYGGGRLTQSEMRVPGRRETVENGDRCPDGSEGVLHIFVNGERLDDWSRYIPQDGDRIRIDFGPPEGEEERRAPPEARPTPPPPPPGR